MTHEFVGIVVEPFVTRQTADDVVAKLIAPFEEKWDQDAEEFSGWWDFWMVGGRWTGVWLKDYEPHSDPLNIDPRPCFICNGTGHRPDIGNLDRQQYIKDFGGCNGCQGNGHQVVYPSGYRPIDQDVLSVATLIDDTPLRTPLRLVLPDAGVIEKSDFLGRYTWDDSPLWNAHVREILAPFRNANIVAVDVHS